MSFLCLVSCVLPQQEVQAQASARRCMSAHIFEKRVSRYVRELQVNA